MVGVCPKCGHGNLDEHKNCLNCKTPKTILNNYEHSCWRKYKKGEKMKEKVIEYLESQGFMTVSHKSSSRQIFFKDNVTVTVEERKITRLK